MKVLKFGRDWHYFDCLNAKVNVNGINYTIKRVEDAHALAEMCNNTYVTKFLCDSEFHYLLSKIDSRRVHLPIYAICVGNRKIIFQPNHKIDF